MDTLVLNTNYTALGLVKWKKAIRWLFDGKIEIIDEYEDREIKTVSLAIKMPSVVRLLTNASKRKKGLKYSDDNIYLRDNGKCQYCGIKVSRDEKTMDHVIPKSQGGKTDFDNIVLSCSPCNAKKGNKTVAQAGMRLLSTPVKPKKLPMIFTMRVKKNAPESWKTWLAEAMYEE